MKIRFQTIEDITKTFLFLVFSFSFFIFIFLLIAKIELIVKVKGRIETKRWYEVVSKASGFVKEVKVEEGNNVKKGDLLIRLEDEEKRKEIERTKLEIERLSLEKESMERNLKVARQSFQNRKREAGAFLSLSLANLEKVRKGAKKEEIELQEAEIHKAEIELVEAKRECERKREEYKEGLISQRELEEIEFKVKKAEANLSLSQKALFLIKNKYSKEDYAIAKAEVEKMKANLKEIENECLKEKNLENKIFELDKEIKKREIELLFLERAFKELEIYSPSSGTVLTRDTQQLIGKFIKPGDVVLKIGEQTEYIVKAKLREIGRPKVKRGQKAKIFVKAFPWGNYKIFNGRVISISQDIVKNGFYEASIVVFDPWVVKEGKMYFLKPGYEVEANIIIEKDRIIKILLKELKKMKGEVLPKNIYL